MIIDSKHYDGMCACGREHRMSTKLAVVESGCLREVGRYIESYGIEGGVVAVYDENTYRATADRHPRVEFEVILPADNLHANERGVAMLEERLPESFGLLLAIGAGTIHDITRYTAYIHGVDFISCPTAASVDGFCSSVAAMTWGGCKKTLAATAPLLVLADLDIIAAAPIRLAKSGLGDLIGKYISLADWKIGNIIASEYYCTRIADIMRDATEAAMRSADGIPAGDTEAYANLTAGLILSGLAMQMLGNSRPASGAEHHISHIIEMAPPPLGVASENLHGEKVGVGTLMVLGEYKRLSRMKNLTFRDYEEYTREEILAVFGEGMAEGIIDENGKDVAAGIKADTVRCSWSKIVKVVEGLPEVEDLVSLYNKLGILSTLEDIGVDNAKLGALLHSSPMVRNRLTLMRLSKCIIA